jgi:hypothetical protein
MNSSLTLNKFVQSLFAAGLVLLAAAAGSRAQSANALPGQAGPRRRITQAINDTQLFTLHGNVHPLARPEFDRGALADWQPVTKMLLLLQRSPEQEAALQKLLEEQQDPSSPNFHKWLTPTEFGQQFGPADADIQTIKDWLASQGFTGIQVSAGKTLIQFDGTAGAVAQAFHTTLHTYHVNAKEHFANASNPQIPAALSPVVAGVVSLHNFRKKPFVHNAGTFRRNMATGEVKPLFTFTDVNGTFFAVGPADFATIYHIPAGADGTGQSIAIVGRSNINLQDVRDFRNVFGLPSNDPQIILNGPDPGLVSGDETEADLDVQWSGAVAPAAKIIFVPTQGTSTDASDGVDRSALYIVDNNVAPILSDSFGLCESSLGTTGNQFYNSLWQQAAAEGITVSVAAGDNGSAGCDDPGSATSAKGGIAVSGLASTPFNFAAGGTDFNQDPANPTNISQFWNTTDTSTTPPVPASAKGYIPELPWNDSCASSGLTGCNTVTSTSQSLNIIAGSGGASTLYPKPSWQSGPGVPNDNHRDLPDVSLFSGDGLHGSFYIICEADQAINGEAGCSLSKFTTTAPFHDFQAVGGTSAAAPAFAGIMALVNQKIGQRQGNPNPVLYKLLATNGVFHDIATGNNSVPCPGGSMNCSKTTTGGFGVLVSGGNAAFQAGTGYDLATGLGSVDVTNLLANWGGVSLGLTGTTTSLTGPSPASLTVGTAVTVSGTVTGSGGTPTGVVILRNAATGAAIQTFPLSLSGGTYSGTTALLPGGSYNVVAHYGGDTRFAPSDSAPVAVTVSKQNSQVVVSFVTFNPDGTVASITQSAQSVQYGSPYILRVDVRGVNQGGQNCASGSGPTISQNYTCPTGTVQLSDNGQPLKDFPNAQNPNSTNSATLNDRGFAEDQPIQLNVGPHSITANYSGDVSYNPASASNTLSVTITQATTTTTVTSSAVSITSGTSVTLTATVTSNSNSAIGPSGTVQFLNNGSNLGASVTCTPAGATSSAGASCTAKLTTAISALPPGFPVPAPPAAPPGVLIWLAAALAILSFFLAARLPKRRRAFAYGAFLLFATMATGLAGCGGSGNTTPKVRTVTITAKYSGDTNYAGSTSAGTSITVQ